MKKVFTLVLCFVMVVCFAACESKSEEKAPEGETAVDTVKDDIKTEEEKTDEGKNDENKTNVTGAVEEEREFLGLSVAKEYESYYDDEIGKISATMEYPIIKLSEKSRTDYPGLAKAIEAVNAEEKADAEAAHNENIKTANSVHKSGVDIYNGYTYETTVEVKRADSSVLTLLFSNYTYTGGAHGYYGFYGRSIDAKTGKELALTDVVTDVSALPELIRKQLEKQWSDVSFISIESVDEIAKDPKSVPWSLDYNGLTLYYNPYHLAPYAAGVQFVTLSYKDNPDLFKSKYVSHPSEYAFQINKATIVSEDVTGDGVYDKISVSSYMDDENYYLNKISINVNENTFEDSDDVWGFEARPVFIRTNNGCYIYVECPGENGYTDIYCYQLGETVKKIGVCDRGIAGNSVGSGENMTWYTDIITNPTSFRLEHRAGDIGTYFGEAEYYVGKSGMPETDDEMFVLNTPGELTLLSDLEVDKYDEKTKTTVGKKILKKGETVIYYATDDMGLEYFKLNDGTLVRVTLDKGEKYPRTINGVSVWEIFDNVCLAG